MAENSEEMKRMEKKMEAMKKVYAEVILNTSKEAAFRVMLSDRKAVQLHRDLVSLKDDYALILLRLHTHFHSQIQEAEARSLNQQKKIDELEAQLGEAEGIIVDLRDEIKQLHEKLETMTNNVNMLSNGNVAERKEPVHECPHWNDALGSSMTSQVSDATAALVGVASPRPTALNYQPFDVTDNYGVPGKSNSKGTFTDDEDISSYIMQNTEADQRRNGYSQRIRAFERNSLPVQLPTLKASEPRSTVNVIVEKGEAKLKNTRLAQSVEKPYPICPLEANEKNLPSIGYNKDQIIETRRRSAGKNARYREAIASLRGKPRKKYVKSWKPPLRGQLKECSSRLNVQSVENLTEAAQTLLENNLCCAAVPDDLSPRRDVMNRCNDVLPDGELDHVVCGERADEEEADEGLKKKIRLTVLDGLVGPELFDVPISEGFGSLHKQVHLHRKGRKNILRKVDENIVHEKGPVERKMDKLTDVSVMASDVLNNDMIGELEMVDR